MLFLLQLAQTAIMSHFAFELLCLRWGEPTAFVKLPWSSLLSPISGGVSESFPYGLCLLSPLSASTVVQIFFARPVPTAFFACLLFHADTLSFRRIFVLKGDTLWARVVAVAIVLVRIIHHISQVLRLTEIATVPSLH
jgi:hypothetical protein